MCTQSLSHVQLSAIPWTVACHTTLSMGFSTQEYWSGLPFPSPEDLPNPGIEPGSPALQADSLPSELPSGHHRVVHRTPEVRVRKCLGPGGGDTPGGFLTWPQPDTRDRGKVWGLAVCPEIILFVYLSYWDRNPQLCPSTKWRRVQG